MRTCVDSKQLGLCDHMPVGQQPHGRYVVGDRVINGGCHCGLPQQIEPACNNKLDVLLFQISIIASHNTTPSQPQMSLRPSHPISCLIS